MLHYVRDGKPGADAGRARRAARRGSPGGQDGPGQAQGKIGLALQTLTPDVASSLGLDRGDARAR